MDEVLRNLTFDFLGQEQHKIMSDAFLGCPDAILVDVRTNEEAAAVCFPLGG